MQTNPCMILLKEWFMTHTNEEFNNSIVKVLNEIGRDDAEKIIRESMLQTGQIIPNTNSINIKCLPPIFLSYHSNDEIQIIQLKDHLEKAGYTCQMYNDHNNLNSVESHIRGAKVIVCCINKLYCETENCSKIFHLALKMKKSFILLHIEEQAWPPEGNLKSILENYLYIDFSIEKNTTYWPESKFIKLLGHIRYYVAPNPEMISQPYHNWFVPKFDNLIFLKTSNEEKQQNSQSDNDIPLIVSHPQIIISYQWDCQNHALSLYKQLTQLGYRIWLNIFQMSGIDTLFDKYTVAIDQSLCLLVCVTPNYMKSIDCQRELSLANSLHKPILPLLFEETDAWPPKDLLLSLFLEKPYIDFRNLNQADRWTEKQFQLLLSQLKKIIPYVHTDKPRHLLDMQRPISAARFNSTTDKRNERISSAPIVPKSQACSLM